MAIVGFVMVLGLGGTQNHEVGFQSSTCGCESVLKQKTRR
jgi:hypothetical protein